MPPEIRKDYRLSLIEERLERLDEIPVLMTKVSTQLDHIGEQVDEVREDVKSLRSVEGRVQALEQAEKERRTFWGRTKVGVVVAIIVGIGGFVAKIVLGVG